MTAGDKDTAVDRFRACVAGIEVEVTTRASGPAPLLGDYARYPGRHSVAQLEIELERIAGFADHRAPSAAHPSFECRPVGRGRLALSRWDAEGTVELATEGRPMRARFRLADSANAAEAVIRAAFSITAPHHGALVVHASAVRDAHAAHVFAGPSGAGKSTIGGLLSRPPWRCHLLSDELLVVRRKDRAWWAYATPFACKAEIEHGACAPIAAFHVLSHAERDTRTHLDRGAALSQLMANILAHVADPVTASAVLDLTADLTEHVPAYSLAFVPHPHVGKVLDITC